MSIKHSPAHILKCYTIIMISLYCMSCRADMNNNYDPRIPPFVNGNIIVAALGAYKLEHQEYPNRLKELVPKYLKIIPEPEWGVDSWIYYANKEYYDNEKQLPYVSSDYHIRTMDSQFLLCINVGHGLYAYRSWRYYSPLRKWDYLR